MKRKVRNLRVKCEHDFIRFHRYFPQCKVPTIDIALLEGIKAPFSRNYAVLFLIFSENSKRALNIYRVFRKLSYVNQPGFFEAQKPRESRLFLFSKRVLAVSPRFQAVLLFQGGRLFFVFSHNYSVPENLIVHDTEREQQVCSSPLPDGKTVRTITSHLC